MASITLGPIFRPCTINGKQKGFCHGIFQWSEIHRPSLMVGGHNGGVVAYPTALVETEDGHVILVNPIDIRFIDSEGRFKQYDFSSEEKVDAETPTDPIR